MTVITFAVRKGGSPPGNRGHLLLFITAIAVYTIIGAGLLALGMHITRNTLRIIQAIETNRS